MVLPPDGERNPRHPPPGWPNPNIAEVKTIYSTNYRDIIAQLRKAADDIESGKWGDVEDAVLVLHTAHGIEVFGWGKAVIQNTIGLMQLGMAKLCRVWQDIEKEQGGKK